MVDRGTFNVYKDLSYIDPRVLSQVPQDRIELLPPSFSPGNWDVICAMSSKESYEHVGNLRFRVCIANNLSTYMKAKNRQEKSAVVSDIVTSIRESSADSGGGFVKQDLITGNWYRASDKAARDKVTQSLRDASKERIPSKTNSKTSRKASSLPSRPAKRKQDVSIPVVEKVFLTPSKDIKKDSFDQAKTSKDLTANLGTQASTKSLSCHQKDGGLCPVDQFAENGQSGSMSAKQHEWLQHAILRDLEPIPLAESRTNIQFLSNKFDLLEQRVCLKGTLDSALDGKLCSPRFMEWTPCPMSVANVDGNNNMYPPGDTMKPAGQKRSLASITEQSFRLASMGSTKRRRSSMTGQPSSWNNDIYTKPPSTESPQFISSSKFHSLATFAEPSFGGYEFNPFLTTQVQD